MQFDPNEWEVVEEAQAPAQGFDPEEWEVLGDAPAPGAKPDFVDRFVKPGMEATRQPKDPAQDDNLWDWGSMKASLRPYVEGARGLAAGSASVGEAAGSGLQYLGNRLGLDGVARAGEKVADYYEGQVQAYAPPEHLRGNVIDDPGMLMDPSFWTYNVGQMAPSLAAAIIPGAGVGKAVQIGGKAIQLTPQVIARASALGQALGAGAAGGALEGAGTYREAMKHGASEEEAARAGEIMGAGSAALNALSFGTMLGKMGGGAAAKAGKHIVAGATEGITEGAEEPWEEYAKSFAHYLETGDFDPDTWGRMLEAAKTRGLNVAGPAALVGAGGSVMAGEGDSSAPKGKGQGQGYDVSVIPTEEAPLDLSEWEEVRNEPAAFPAQADQFTDQVTREAYPTVDTAPYLDEVGYDFKQAGQDMAQARNLESQQPDAQEQAPVGPVGEEAGRKLEQIVTPAGQPGEVGEQAGALLEQGGQPQRFELGELGSEWEIVEDAPAQADGQEPQGLDYDFDAAGREVAGGRLLDREKADEGGEQQHSAVGEEAGDRLTGQRPFLPARMSDSPQGEAVNPDVYTEAQLSKMGKGALNRVATALGIAQPGKVAKSKLVPMVMERQEARAASPVVVNEAQAKPVVFNEGPDREAQTETLIGAEGLAPVTKSPSEGLGDEAQAGAIARAETSESKENPLEERDIVASKSVADTEASNKEGVHFKKSDGKPFTEKSVRLVVASQIRRGVNAEAVEVSPGKWGWREVMDEESPAKADMDARAKIRASIEEAVPVGKDGTRDYDTMLAQADRLIDEGGYSVDDVYEVVNEIDEAEPVAGGEAQEKPPVRAEATSMDAQSETKAAVSPIEDVGEKIGGARKDRWKDQGMTVGDLDGIAESEAATLVRKDAVWPKTDYKALIESGVEPKAAAIIKIIRDRIGVKPRENTPEGRRNYIEMLGHVRDVLGGVKTEEEAKQARHEIFKRVGWSRNASSFSVPAEVKDKAFSIYKGRSEPTAIRYKDLSRADRMLADGWPDKSKTREAVARDDLGSKPPKRPHLDKVERIGEDVRGGKDVTGEDVLERFGFRGIEYGNWAAQDERQKALNLAYEALDDLANVLDIPRRAVSLNGTLGLAFGARGGGSAAAHYEPGRLVINLTKLRGAGTLAHEWGHALDHYFGEIDRKGAYSTDPTFISGGDAPYRTYRRRIDNLRPVMVERFQGVLQAIFRRNRTKADAVRDTELSIEEMEAQIAKSEGYGETSKDPGFLRRNKKYLASARRVLALKKRRLAELRGEDRESYGDVTSSFYEQAQRLSGKTGKRGYWARPTEMLARSFEAYVFDRIGDKGNVSQYLVQGVEEDRYGVGYKGNPYPAGVEREAINKAWDKLFETMKSKETERGVALFSRQSPSTEGIRADEVSDVVDRLQTMAVNAPDVKVVQSMNNLPAHVRHEHEQRGNGVPESAYDEATGTVYFVADNIDSRDRTVALWLHEAGLHNGVRGLFSSARHYRNAMAQVYRSAPRRRLREIEKRYGYSRGNLEDNLQAAEEYLAQVAEKVRMREVLAPRERTIWQRIVSAIQRFARRALRGGRLSDTDIAGIVHDAVRWTVSGKPTGAARNAYQRATGEAMARITSGTARFSRGKGRKGGKTQQPWPQTEWTPESAGRQVAADMAAWRNDVDEFQDNKFERGRLLQFGRTPDVLRKLGAKDLPMVMTQEHAAKVLKGKHSESTPLGVVKELPLSLWNPVMVFDSATMPSSFVVVTDLKDRKGDQVVVAVHYNTREQRANVNVVASAYGKERFAGWALRQQQAGRLRFVDKKGASALQRSDRLQLPREMQYRGKTKILTENDIVKPLGMAKFSRGAGLKGGVKPKDQDPGFWAMAREMKRRGALKEKDLGLMEKILRQPYWLAKDHEKFQPFIKIEQDREAARTDALLRSWDEVDGHLKALDKEGRAILSKIIWRIEGTKVQGVEADKFVKDGQDENGHQMYRVNQRHYEQLYKVLTEHNAPEDVARAVCAIRRTLDRDMLAAYNRLRRMRAGVEDDEYVKQYRTKMGRVHNYFPHIRRGTHYVRVYDTESGETLYREHFNAPIGMKRFKGAKVMRQALAEIKKQYPEANIGWDWGKNQGLPEDVYGYTIPVDAMQQILDAAVDRRGGDFKQRDEAKKILSQAVADVLKTRGWSKHTIKRQGIPGHETEDIAGLLFEYKAGLYGWLTKMDAAKAFTGELYNIDAKKTPRLYGYAARYVQDMLQNSDRIDQIVSMVKAGAFIKFLGGNLKTATLNLTQNLVAGVPRLYADTSAKTAAGYFKAAVDDLAAQAKVKTLKADEAKLLKDLYYSGVTADQYMRELQGEMRGVGGVTGAVARKANQWLGMPMSIAERYNRCSLALAAYRAARDGQVTAADTLEKAGKKKGEKWGYDDAKSFAEGIVYDSHFMYGKANRPELFRGGTGNKIMSAAYTFRTFTHGLLSLWRNLLTKKGGAGRRAFAMSLAANTTLGGLSSLPMYALVVGLIRQLFGKDPVEEVMQATDNQALRDIMVYGALAPAGVTISGSLGMELPMLDRFDVREGVTDQIKGNALEIIGVPWALVESLADAGGQILDGNPGRAVETLAPASIANIMKAYRLHKEGTYTKSGRPINTPGEAGPMKLTPGEAIKQAVGFYPLRRAKSYDLYRTVEDLKAYRLSKQDELVKGFLDAVREKDDKARAEVLAEWRAWNKRMRDDGRTEYLIEPLPKLARRRAKARQPEKRMRGRAERLKEEMGL